MTKWRIYYYEEAIHTPAEVCKQKALVTRYAEDIAKIIRNCRSFELENTLGQKFAKCDGENTIIYHGMKIPVAILRSFVR